MISMRQLSLPQGVLQAVLLLSIHCTVGSQTSKAIGEMAQVEDEDVFEVLHKFHHGVAPGPGYSWVPSSSFSAMTHCLKMPRINTSRMNAWRVWTEICSRMMPFCETSVKNNKVAQQGCGSCTAVCVLWS